MTQSPLTEPKKLWNIPYILVLTVSTLSSFSFYMVATILSKYLVGLDVYKRQVQTLGVRLRVVAVFVHDDIAILDAFR